MRHKAFCATSSVARQRLIAVLAQRVGREDPLLDRLIVKEMPFHEFRNPLRGHAVIPGPFRVDEHGRSVLANAQAADLGAVTAVGAETEASLFEDFLQRLPGRLAHLGGATVGTRAQEHMAAIIAYAELGGNLL